MKKKKFILGVRDIDSSSILYSLEKEDDTEFILPIGTTYDFSIGGSADVIGFSFLEEERLFVTYLEQKVFGDTSFGFEFKNDLIKNGWEEK